MPAAEKAVRGADIYDGQQSADDDHASPHDGPANYGSPAHDDNRGLYDRRGICGRRRCGRPWAAIGPAAYVGEIATTIPTSSAVANKIECVDFIRALSFKNSRKAYASHAVGAMNGLWP